MRIKSYSSIKPVYIKKININEVKLVVSLIIF